MELHHMTVTELARALDAAPLPPADPAFGLAPQLTLTGIQAGDGGYTQVPDRCELRIDLRLTPGFNDAQARALVQATIERQDADHAGAAATMAIVDAQRAQHAARASPGLHHAHAARSTAASVTAGSANARISGGGAVSSGKRPSPWATMARPTVGRAVITASGIDNSGPAAMKRA